EERRPAHSKHVVERVRRRDRAVVAGVVDDRREEVEREDQGALGVEPVDGGVVRGCETDEEVLGFRRNESREQLFQARGRVLRSASAARGEVRQLHSAGLGVQASSVWMNWEM